MLIETSQVQVSGPLSGFAAGFADELTRATGVWVKCQLGHHLSLLAHLNRWLRGRDLGADEPNMTEVERFLLARRLRDPVHVGPSRLAGGRSPQACARGYRLASRRDRCAW
jgi:hypothetical protein